MRYWRELDDATLGKEIDAKIDALEQLQPEAAVDGAREYLHTMGLSVRRAFLDRFLPTYLTHREHPLEFLPTLAALSEIFSDYKQEVDAVYDEIPVSLRHPRHIDHYRIQRHVKCSAQGWIVTASSTQHVDTVAIKYCRTNDRNAAERLRQEARILSQCRHPHIVKCLDSGDDTEESLTYFVMPWLTDGALHRIHRNVEWSLKETLSVMQQLCEAITYLHRRVIYHRDIKPSNIHVCHGEAVLLDFGIAEEAHTLLGDDVPNHDRSFTAEYCAPEVIAGHSNVERDLADVFSLGGTLGYLVTSASPSAETESRLDQFHQTVRTTAGRAVAQVICKATAWNPAERYRSAEELRTAIAKISGSLHRSESWNARLQKPVPILFATLTVLLLSLMFFRQRQTAETQPSNELTTADVDRAVEVIDRLKSHRNLAEQGQSTAIPLLVSQNWNFSRENLSGLSLSGIDLGNGQFQSVDFRFAEFVGTTANGANFEEADFDFGTFDEASLQQCRFLRACGRYIDAKGAVFRDCDFSGANFSYSDFSGADFSGSDFSNSAFTHCNLTETDFSNANMTNMQINGSVVLHASFVDATMTAVNVDQTVFDLPPQLLPAQCQVVARRPHYVAATEILEVWESSQFATGREYKTRHRESYVLQPYIAGRTVPPLIEQVDELPRRWTGDTAGWGPDTILLQRSLIELNARYQVIHDRIRANLVFIEELSDQARYLYTGEAKRNGEEPVAP